MNQFIQNLYLPKTIALLELTGGYFANDITVKNTLEYYWRFYRDEFKSFPIVDTGGSIPKTLELLDKYYAKGYRYFYGFSRSTIVNASLNWFNMHPDAIGISSTSTAPNLSIPKKIFRMTPTDDYILDSILPQVYPSPTVYYIYTEGEVAMLNVLAILQADPLITNLKTYAVNSSNLTVTNISTFLSGSTSQDSIILYLLDREPYIDLYNQGLTFAGNQYDITGIVPPKIVGSGAISQLTNKYLIISYKGIQTSILWRRGYDTLGVDNYSIVSLNAINLLNSLVYKKSVTDINSHFGILQFDPVSSDIIYPCFLVEIFNGTIFASSYLLVNDPILGSYQANLIS